MNHGMFNLNVNFFRLRERELQLQSDLTTASREINRLRKEMATGPGAKGRIIRREKSNFC